MATTRKTKTGSAKKSPPKPVRKAPAKRAAVTVAKKPAARKPGAQAKPARAAKKAPMTPSRTVVRKTAAKRRTPTEAPAKKGLPPQKPAARKPAHGADAGRLHFSKHDLNAFKLDLLSMRERITGQSGAMRHAALQRTDETNPEEDGTDAFMRLQTLKQVSSQQQIITNIDEALRSIEKGSYGVCDACGELISKPRLAVLPFAKNCIRCQSEMEKQIRCRGRR